MKKVYDKKWGLLKDKHSCYWIPTIVTAFNPYTFLETGVCTPSFTIMIKFLKYSLGFSIQESY